MEESQIMRMIEDADKRIDDLRPLVVEAQRRAMEMEAKRLSLIKERYEIRQKLAKFAPFKVGDKVTVSECVLDGPARMQNWKDAYGMVSKVIVFLTKKNGKEFEYKVNKIKKDGTMSANAIRYKNDSYREDQMSLI